MTKQSEKTMILCVQQIAHISLLACVSVGAHAIAHILGMVKHPHECQY